MSMIHRFKLWASGFALGISVGIGPLMAQAEPLAPRPVSPTSPPDTEVNSTPNSTEAIQGPAEPESAVGQGQLQVVVEGLRNQTGLLCAKLFSGSRGFPNQDDSAVERQCVPIAETPMSLTFADLPFGSYAIALYHDQNGDELMNRGAFGMPIEAYGFSNDPVVNTGPPSYQDAVFLLAGPQTTVPIQLRYPF